MARELLLKAGPLTERDPGPSTRSVSPSVVTVCSSGSRRHHAARIPNRPNISGRLLRVFERFEHVLFEILYKSSAIAYTLYIICNTVCIKFSVIFKYAYGLLFCVTVCGR